MSKANPTCFAIFAGALLTVATAVAAQEPALSTPDIRNLIVERIYPYTVQKYTPPFALPEAAPSRGAASTPEEALACYFSSMKEGDFGWNNSCWTAESVSLMRQLDARNRRTPAQWVAEWRSFYPARDIVLLHRIEFARFVLIEYQTRRRDGAGSVTSDTLALTKAGDGWKLTQELADDPIMTHWRSDKPRVQLPPASLFSKKP